MIKIKKLTIENVGRFVGVHEIDFENLPNFLQVDAQNLITGGSSGSGKSTIFNSIEYALNINDIPSTVLQSRLTKNHMEVSLDLEVDEKKIKIVRSKSKGLSLYIDGSESISGGNKNAEEELDKILGIGREMLRKMMHKRQNEGGFFLALTPKELYSFFIEMLNLKDWIEKSSTVELEVKTLEQDMETLTKDGISKNNLLKSLNESLESIKNPVCETNEEEIAELSIKIAEIKKNILEIKDKEEKLISVIERPQTPSVIVTSNPKLLEIESQISTIRADIDKERSVLISKKEKIALDLSRKKIEKTQLESSTKKESSLKNELEKIKSDILKIRSGTCPTCNQAWYSGHNDINILISSAKNINEELLKIGQIKNQLPQIGIDVELLTVELSKVSTEPPEGLTSLLNTKLREMAELHAERDREAKQRQEAYSVLVRSYEDRVSQIRGQTKESLSKLEAEKEKLDFAFLDKTVKLNNYKTEVNTTRQIQARLVESKKATEAELATISSLIEEKKITCEIASLALRTIKSYISTMFQDTLNTIAEKSSKIVSKIPNMSTASISFDGFKETKSGKIKEEIVSNISIDGEMGIPIKSLSGGERTAIDLAVDLAVIETLEEFSGVGIDLFILDEPFNGLDSISREQCLEVLKQNMGSRKIIVVDHSEETKQLVSGKILIIRDGQESRVEL